jgi:hypothetical protein
MCFKSLTFVMKQVIQIGLVHFKLYLSDCGLWQSLEQSAVGESRFYRIVGIDSPDAPAPLFNSHNSVFLNHCLICKVWDEYDCN